MSRFIGSEYVTRMEMSQPPQPAESPDDWVEITDPSHVPRVGIDWFEGPNRQWEVQAPHHIKVNVGAFADMSGGHKHRCRRKDYPQQPAEVHTGGPYVARSEYERVQNEVENEKASSGQVIAELRGAIYSGDRTLNELKVKYDLAIIERDSLQKQLEAWQETTSDQIQDLRHEVSYQQRAKAELLNDMKIVAEERDKLREEQKALLADLKDIEQTVIHLNKRVFANNPNGWPLVPVDPACIPDEYRPVEVTDQVNGKTTVIDFGRVHKWDTKSQYVQLVVEQISAEQPATVPLPRPEFPAWIRPGWWVAMDADREWYMYEHCPVHNAVMASHDSEAGTYTKIPSQCITESMRAVPRDRWREAKWQVE